MTAALWSDRIAKWHEWSRYPSAALLNLRFVFSDLCFSTEYRMKLLEMGRRYARLGCGRSIKSRLILMFRVALTAVHRHLQVLLPLLSLQAHKLPVVWRKRNCVAPFFSFGCAILLLLLTLLQQHGWENSTLTVGAGYLSWVAFI